MSAYLWWQSGVIYQIYPRSFKDGSGDGVGDLLGIIGQLDYCVKLGVDALWLSPIYPSPMADFGYDIANFTAIDPIFGTLADFEHLLFEVKRRGMKLILDYVPNHTSNRHPWFEESRASRDSARRDWYLWRDPAPGGGPPNNWLSNFGGSAWQWDEATSQYYYHAFLKEQPDLNWRNPAVIEAMHEVMRFWLSRGVDGFRIDVLWLLIKDDQWRDNPPNADFRPGMPAFHSQLPVYTSDRPEVMDVVRGLRRIVDEFTDRVLIGEVYLPLDRLMAYYGSQLQGIQLPFNFLLLQNLWDAPEIAALINRYETAIPRGGWPNWVLGNHDNPRIATRVGAPQAPVAAMLLLTLRGTPTMYYGDEIGMANVPIPPDRVRDPLEKNVPGKGLGRDPCRTPMQWDASRNAGFSYAEPWLPVAANYPHMNVQTESAQPASILHLYRKLIELRRAHRALSIGATASVTGAEGLLSYVRHDGGERFLVALNLGAKARVLALSPEMAGRVVLSSYLDQSGDAPVHEELALRPNEGLIVALTRDEGTAAP
jgi:alpha-glucosidase